MSGFEVAGIVLGTLPLLVSALETYSKFMRDWGKAPSELRSLNRQLTTERAKLYNVCDLLISDAVSHQDIEPMLLNPFGPLWKVKETNDKIRRRLWDAYKPFEETVIEVDEALQSIMQRLGVQVSVDGEVEWMNKGKITRDFKKLLYRINREDYNDSLATISKGISDLETLIRLSIHLEPSRRKQSRGKLFKILRDLSTSIYRALSSSIICTGSHDVSLELQPRLIELGHEEEHEKVFRDAQFKVAISFEIVRGPATKRFWDEVNIKTATPVAVVKSRQSITEVQTQSLKRVSFGLKQTLSLRTSTKSHDMKSAMAIFSRPATDIAFIKTCQDEDKNVAQKPLNLCTALIKAREERPVCYGHLVDAQCTDRLFQVYPLGTTANSDDWSIVTLEDVLEGKKGLRQLVSLAERVRLALAIASSVLQLSKTPWLPEVLTRRNVHFFRRDDNFSYKSPFLLRQFPIRPLEPLHVATPSAKSGCPPLVNPTLFALGILLLEIITGSSFEKQRSSEEQAIAGDYDGIIRASIAAHRLLEQRVALINPVYKAVVQRCIDCTESSGLDEDSFRQEVYNDVVMQLEAILESTKLGS
ncbi:hypothetical protein FAVG1_11529 [Fusarium avenaceum]|nr:hypothetical protein FAVG1_11529 [Fusarium avenaceum]